MLAHPHKVIKIPYSAAILELNSRRAPSVMNSFINNQNSTNFLFLAIQEPPINARTNAPFGHSGWHLIVTTPPDLLEASRPRSCIYVNTQADAIIQPINSSLRDVSACTAKVHDIEIFLINVYNQLATLDGFEALDRTLIALPLPILHLPTIVVTDSNSHSPIWNPDTYHKQDVSADSLIETMTKWNLYLRSPKGVVTYEAKLGMESGTTINLVWVNQQSYDVLVACLVDTKAPVTITPITKHW